MSIDGAFWRELREDFERLQGHEFSIIWESSRPLSFAGEPLDSYWSWFRFPDDSLRARLSAIALRGARAFGYETEDAWYDLLRRSGFVRFELSGSSRQRRSDGVMVDSDSGQIDDVVKESITLCYELEAAASSPRSLPTSPPRSPTPSANPEDLADIAEREPPSEAVRIMHAAMQQLGLNPPKLAGRILQILRRTRQTKTKVDRTTIYRILEGKTKKPQPSTRNALIEALQLSGEAATIVRRELGGGH